MSATTQDTGSVPAPHGVKRTLGPYRVNPMGFGAMGLTGPGDSREDPPVPIVARVVWAEDGEEMIETVAAGWSGQNVYVRLPDTRYRLTSVWLDAADSTALRRRETVERSRGNCPLRRCRADTLSGEESRDEALPHRRGRDMTDQSYEVITSEEQAARVKADMSAGSADEHVKIWHHARAFTVTLAADFANRHPAQGAGEAVFSVRDDGQVDVFLFW